MLGCVRFNDAEELDAVLNWMDENTDGKPYGVDIVMPAKVPDGGHADRPRPVHPGRAPPRSSRRRCASSACRRCRPTATRPATACSAGCTRWRARTSTSRCRHPIKLIANALGSPPKDVIDEAHAHGVPVAALAGKAKHARSHVDNGVDIVIAQGTEAGGHTGEIATMVLVPEIVDAVGDDAHVLAAGGIGSGRQIAAALALGAGGVWMGSYWLTTSEYTLGTGDAMQRALVAAGSDQTVRARVYSGKPARLLKTKWTDAWAEPGAPDPLPMPLQNLLVSEAHQRIAARRRPRGGGDAGRADRRPDERGAAGRRADRRSWSPSSTRRWTASTSPAEWIRFSPRMTGSGSGIDHARGKPDRTGPVRAGPARADHRCATG